MLADPGWTGDRRHLLDALPRTAADVAARARLDPSATWAVLGLLAVAGDVEADAGVEDPVFRRSGEQGALAPTHARSLRR